jgi:hypothetical protein
MNDLDIRFNVDEGEVAVTVSDDGQPVLELTVTDFDFEEARNVYSCFTVDDSDRYKVNIYMEAPHTEHEEERGSLALYEHPMTAGLTLEDVETYPFREEWYRAGMQTFERLTSF